MSYRRQLALVFGLALGLAGCSAHMVKPKGRLMNGTTPFKCEPGDVVHITFMPEEAGPDSEQGACVVRFNGETGEFEAVEGLRPGKYRVSVQVMKHRKDIFDGALSGPGSPFLVDVAPHPEEILLDVTQAQAKRSATRDENAGGRRTRRPER